MKHCINLCRIQKTAGRVSHAAASANEGAFHHYEDTDILIADKPYNMLSQKAKEQDLSANEYLLGYLIRSGALSLETFGTFRPSVCNRLDRNTTGLLLMGKTLAGAQMLSEGLRERTIHKFYRAIVSGNVTKPVHLSGWLIKDEHTNQVKILTQEQKDAVWIETSYTSVQAKGTCSLLEICLITGKHIRFVHIWHLSVIRLSEIASMGTRQ